MRTRGGLLGILLVALVIAACNTPKPTSAPPPTRDEALSFLAQIVALAQQGDFDALCSMAGDGNCEFKLDDAGRDRVPSAAPTVWSIAGVPTTTNGDQTSLGGIVLGLCGIDALGRGFDSEMLVFRDTDTTMRAINPVYWGQDKVARGDRTSLGPPDPGGC